MDVTVQQLYNLGYQNYCANKFEQAIDYLNHVLHCNMFEFAIMDTNPENNRKVTIQDVLDEYELELMGITHSIDGTPVSSSSKRSEFLEDCGMWEDTILLEIKDKYRGKLRDDKIREKYLDEYFGFTQEYFFTRLDEYLKSLDKNKSE